MKKGCLLHILISFLIIVVFNYDSYTKYILYAIKNESRTFAPETIAPGQSPPENKCPPHINPPQTLAPMDNRPHRKLRICKIYIFH